MKRSQLWIQISLVLNPVPLYYLLAGGLSWACSSSSTKWGLYPPKLEQCSRKVEGYLRSPGNRSVHAGAVGRKDRGPQSQQEPTVTGNIQQSLGIASGVFFKMQPVQSVGPAQNPCVALRCWRKGWAGRPGCTKGAPSFPHLNYPILPLPASLGEEHHLF